MSTSKKEGRQRATGDLGDDLDAAGAVSPCPHSTVPCASRQGSDMVLLARHLAMPDGDDGRPDPAELGDPDDWPPPFGLAVLTLQRGAPPEDVLAALPADALRAILAADPDGEPAAIIRERSDLGNAERMIDRYGDDLRYCAPLGGWLAWDGRRWEVDATGAVQRMAQETVRNIYAEVNTLPDPSALADAEARKAAGAKREALLRHALSSESAARQRALLDLAWSQQGIAVTPDVWDADPWLLNVANGTLDLRTGELCEHRRADLLTKLAPVAYDPTAIDPVLDAYLAHVAGDDPAFASFLQRAIGYSLTGDTSEEVLFLVLGPATTGKSTLVEAMLAMLGDYARKASFDTFLERRDVGGARPDIAGLRGVRLAAAVETAKSRRLDEPLVKELTGGDTVTARHLYREPLSFIPQAKIWLACNESPRLTDTDTGLWRRLLRVPFEHQLADPDPAVKARLKTEASPALLAWAVNGCLAWQRERLGRCEVVNAATAELRAEMDPLGEFYADCCVFGPEYQTLAAELRQAYESWAASSGAKAIGNREWGQRLRAKSCENGRERIAGQRVKIWRGIGLIEDGTDGTDKRHFRESISVFS